VALILQADNDVYTAGGLPYLIPRDANHSPLALMAGLTSSDVFKVAQFTNDGKLIVQADIGVPSIFPEVDMRARDISNVAQYLQVEEDPVTSRFALLVNDPRLAFNGDKLKVDASVTMPDTPGDQINTYDEITNQIFAAYHTIVSYTVPAAKIFKLRHVSVSGSNKAEYRILGAGASVIAKRRTSYTNFNEDFFFESDDTIGTKFTAGQVVYVDVMHSNALANGNFNATISGRLENA
jgi:hypothetical protein